jgi:hypothetical protein
MGPFKKGPIQESDRILQLIKDKKALDKEQREEERHVELMGALGAISSGLPPTFHGGGS